MALGTVGKFWRVDVGDAHALAATPDRVAVLNGKRHAQGSGSENDRQARQPSAIAPHSPNLAALPALALAPIVTRRASIHTGELGRAAARQRRSSALSE